MSDKKVTHAEAQEILSRFNASHWNNGKERARYSIPARPDYDDDIRLADYIEQAEETEKQRNEAIRVLHKLAEHMTEHVYQELASALEAPPRSGED